MTRSAWFVCPGENPEAEMRLFLFPYAGSGPTAFHLWDASFPARIETWMVHYPGRGSRYHEPPITQLAVLVERICQAIQPLLDKPFAFFGHSLGGLVAFELTRQLVKNYLPQPQILFVSACGAPQFPDPHPPIHSLPDDEFLEALKQLNGIPAEVANTPELMELLLPSLRADFEIFENSRYLPDQPPMSIPIIAYGGLEDPRLSRERLEGWASQTTSEFKAIFFPGDHFFLKPAKDEIIRSIAEELRVTNSRKKP